jgi:hypothetical protein
LGAAFDALWMKDGKSYPGHLPLLNLRGCEREIRIVREAVGAQEVEPTIRAMLADPNWRPNLVAAVAVLFLPPDGRLAAPLWQALDEGSWVSPQLAVVLSLHDPGFAEAAIRRAWRQCPMTPERWGERFAGKPNPKTLAALIAILGDLRPDEAQRMRADPGIAPLLGEACEGGDRIALDWRRSLAPYLPRG